MRTAGVEVAVDFGEPEVVKFAVLDRQRRDELAGIARQQVSVPDVPLADGADGHVGEVGEEALAAVRLEILE